jgi:hypothetical protein
MEYFLVISVMKYLYVHLSGLVRSPTDPNVPPIDTYSNERNCSTHIYMNHFVSTFCLIVSFHSQHVINTLYD